MGKQGAGGGEKGSRHGNLHPGRDRPPQPLPCRKGEASFAFVEPGTWIISYGELKTDITF